MQIRWYSRHTLSKEREPAGAIEVAVGILSLREREATGAIEVAVGIFSLKEKEAAVGILFLREREAAAMTLTVSIICSDELVLNNETHLLEDETIYLLSIEERRACTKPKSITIQLKIDCRCE